MATTLIDWRPSALPVVCPSIVPLQDTLPEAQVRVVALPAVPTVVWTASSFAGLGYAAVERPGADPLGAVTLLNGSLRKLRKLNNSIGTPAAMSALGLAATGATTSSVIAVATDDLRNQQHADKVKGANARGIPPRGRRRV